MITTDELLAQMQPQIDEAVTIIMSKLYGLLGAPMVRACAPELARLQQVLPFTLERLLREASYIHSEHALAASEQTTRMLFAGLAAGQVLGLRDAGAELDPEGLQRCQEAIETLATGGPGGGNEIPDTLNALLALGHIRKQAPA